ncbi:hypothetical protein Syun_027101 [Stephania yunnanensis]|uniref:Receptor-like serine/threonine-protein kinase n=1 Tax=Stephania yunnanensis TaxID=152371 RepID=A0AAP0HQZ9_9MAGN
MDCFIALLILYSFFNINNVCFATDDTITPNKVLRDGDTLVSKGGTFALGFFSPGNSQKRYIGIWFNKVPEQTVVWVANRNNPINNSSSLVAKIGYKGNLVIFDGNSSDHVWSTNVSIPISTDHHSINSSALFYKLLDTGNLVLRDENKGDLLWQSFDYPTDTLIPGMKLGMNSKWRLNWSLTSWKSRDDPSTGDFVMSLGGRDSPECFVKKGSRVIWRTGPWNGQTWNGVPVMTTDFIYHFSFLNSPDETSFSYGFNITSSVVFSRIFIDNMGVFHKSTQVEDGYRWNDFYSSPGDTCDYYSKCGAFGSCKSNNAQHCSCLPGFEPKSPRNWYFKDGSHGCVRKRELSCGKGDGFLKLAKVKLPDTSNARVDMSLGIEDCEIKCRNNCSCTGFSSAYVDGSGCITWFGDLTDIREFTEGGQDLFVRVDAIELGLVLQRGIHQIPVFDLPTSECNEETNAKFQLPIFDLASLMVATENFSHDNKLGTGGFGSVYKGKLSDGREIAVKRLSKNSGQGVNEFKNEVLLIARLQHRSLVQIIGCCVEEEEKMLIYEYMPNKSLDFLLFDRTRSSSLDWELRRDIILGIARGVLYLHQDSRLRIVHRDLKASNILLDAEMNPKISDFGMARIFGSNQTQGNTNRVVGTYGYMSPEYAMHGLFSIKSDVFSFGVLLLEIISGKKNTEFCYEDHSMNLMKHAWELWRDGRPLELVDPSIGSSFPEQEVAKFIQVGIFCVQENAKDRPTMSGVMMMLGNEAPIPSLRQPAFVLTSKFNSPDSSTAGSLNEISNSIVNGR